RRKQRRGGGWYAGSKATTSPCAELGYLLHADEGLRVYGLRLRCDSLLLQLKPSKEHFWGLRQRSDVDFLSVIDLALGATEKGDRTRRPISRSKCRGIDLRQ